MVDQQSVFSTSETEKASSSPPNLPPVHRLGCHPAKSCQNPTTGRWRHCCARFKVGNSNCVKQSTHSSRHWPALRQNGSQTLPALRRNVSYNLEHNITVQQGSRSHETCFRTRSLELAFFLFWLIYWPGHPKNYVLFLYTKCTVQSKGYQKDFNKFWKKSRWLAPMLRERLVFQIRGDGTRFVGQKVTRSSTGRVTSPRPLQQLPIAAWRLRRVWA